ASRSRSSSCWRWRSSTTCDAGGGRCPCSCASAARWSCTSGAPRGAPPGGRRRGGEWFFRFLLEPRRLFHRYFVRDLRFLPIMRLELRAARELGLVRPRRLRLVGPGWLWMLIPLLSF